jgi:Tfp pilus assembly protein PilO
VLFSSLIIFVIILTLNIVFTTLLLNKIVGINNLVNEQNIISQTKMKEFKLSDSIENTKIDREKLIKYFIPAGNLQALQFTKYLEDLALENSVSQSKTLNYTPALGLESAENLTALNYKLRASGNWVNIFSFLRAVENLPKVMYLSEVSLRQESGVDSAPNQWSADLDFSVIKFKD